MIRNWIETNSAPSPMQPTQPGNTAAEVTVSVSEVLPTMANAFQQGFQWIHDFADEQIKISSDLLELIQAAKSQDRHASD